MRTLAVIAMRTLAVIAILAFVVAYVANKEIPEKLGPPPPKAADVLQQGRDLYDAWNNPKTRSKVSLSAISQIITDLDRVPASDPLHTTTEKAIAVLRLIQQEMLKLEDRAKEAQKTEKDAGQARLLRDVFVIRHLRSAMSNPESFHLEEATRMKDGTLCITYRATNRFSALVVSRAVINAERILTSDDRDRFATAWTRLCANKSGTDIKDIRNLL